MLWWEYVHSFSHCGLKILGDSCAAYHLGPCQHVASNLVSAVHGVSTQKIVFLYVNMLEKCIFANEC